jgi:hypothetical protein
LTSAGCSQLASGQVISGTGDMQVVENATGVHVVVNGTATDNLGNTWRFNYAQDVRFIGSDEAQIEDHFNLAGGGGSLRLHSHFVIIFGPDGPVDVKQVTGDFEHCDPI